MRKINKIMSEVFKNIVLANKEMIGVGNIPNACCLIVHEDKKLEMVPLMFSSSEHKEQVRNALIQKISKLKVFGYVLVFDTRMTKFDQKTQQPTTVVDAVVSTLCTPNGSAINTLVYEGEKVVEEMELNDPTKSEWDIWSESFDYTDPEDKKTIYDYAEFKRLNPDKFTECK